MDGEHLSASVPATNVANAGTASVTVVNPGPGGGASNIVYFPVASPQTTISFVNAANSPLPISEAGGVTIGDFNGDGKPDLIVTRGISFHVFLGNGDGTFTAGSVFEVPSPPYDDLATPIIGGITTADLNHSGHLGFVVALGENEAAAIFFGKGDGTFLPSSAAFAAAAFLSFSATGIADFNGDGNLDLAFPSFVSLGYGDGAFTRAGDLSNGGFTEASAIGDFNGDGRLDVAVTSGGSQALPVSGLAVSLGNGDGTFTAAPGSPISLGNSLSGIIAADFNGDGKLDLAMTDAGGNTVIILLGNGDGTFSQAPGSPIVTGNSPGAIVAGDLNNDGKLDLAVANFNCTAFPLNCGQGTVTILLGNGDGTFTQAGNSPVAVAGGPSSLALADFNGDGRLDLALTSTSDGTVSILLQQ